MIISGKFYVTRESFIQDSSGSPRCLWFFAKQPEVLDCLNKAEALLSQVEIREITFDKFRDFLDTSGMREVLTKPYPQLGNLSPMAVLRQKAKEEVQSSRTIEHTMTPSTPETREAKRQTVPQRSQQSPQPSTIYESHSLGKRAVVMEKADIGKVGKDIESVHLGHQQVINITTIKTFVELGTIKILEIPKSQERLIGPGIKELLDQHGVELRIGRVRHRNYYDEQSEATGGYLYKKRFWENVTSDPQKAETLERLKEYELEEVEMVGMYLSKNPSRRRESIRGIADKFGFPYHTAQIRMTGLLCFLGMKYRNEQTKGRAREIASIFSRLEAARPSREKQEELRRSFAVEDQLPPQTLKPYRWEGWQKVVSLSQSMPELFNQLKEANPRWHATIMHYYQLDDPDMWKISMTKFAESQLGVSRETGRQYKNQALGFIGLLEE